MLTDQYKKDINEDHSRYRGKFILAFVRLLVLHKNTEGILTPFELAKVVRNYAP